MLESMSEIRDGLIRLAFFSPSAKRSGPHPTKGAVLVIAVITCA